MNNDLIKVDTTFNVEDNFWQKNPTLTVISPFAQLYQRDTSEDKTISSKEAWAIFLYTDASQRNKLYRIPADERKIEIKENYCPHIDWEDELIVKAIESYPELCMSIAGRAFKGWEDKLIERDAFMRNMVYNEETFEILDKMLSNTKKVWDMYKQVYDQMMSEEQQIMGKGARKLSKAEKGEI